MHRREEVQTEHPLGVAQAERQLGDRQGRGVRGQDRRGRELPFESGLNQWSDIGVNGSPMPLFSPAVSRRRSMPSFSIAPVAPKLSISTPIEPTIEALSA